MTKKNSGSGKSSGRINSGTGPKPLIKAHGERRDISPTDAAYYATQNPELFQDGADTPASASSKPIKTHSNRPTAKKTHSAPQANTPDANFYQSILNERDQELEDDDDISSDYSIDSDPNMDPELAKAKKRYGGSSKKATATQNYSYDEEGNEEREESFLSNAELIIKTSDYSKAQLSALELNVLGFETEIEQDYDKEYLVYKMPAEIIAFEDKDQGFKKVGSGVYVDAEGQVWYLNSNQGQKYLVKTGNLSEITMGEKPPNYDLIKLYTPKPEVFQLEGSDLNILMGQTGMLTELGIEVLDPRNNTVSLSKYSKQEIQEVFLSYGISALITEIYQSS
jgi:hypothetical protein